MTKYNPVFCCRSNHKRIILKKVVKNKRESEFPSQYPKSSKLNGSSLQRTTKTSKKSIVSQYKPNQNNWVEIGTNLQQSIASLVQIVQSNSTFKTLLCLCVVLFSRELCSRICFASKSQKEYFEYSCQLRSRGFDSMI